MDNPVRVYADVELPDPLASVHRSGRPPLDNPGSTAAWSARDRDTTTGFWRRRFARIYPSHVVTFAVAALTLVWMGKALNPAIALGNPSLTQAWVPNRTKWWFGYNGVSWSLSCEALFYLTFPFAIRLVRRLSTRGLWATVTVANVCVTLFPLFTAPVGWATGWDAKCMLYMLPPARLIEFVAGIALALLVKNGSWRGPGLTASLALSLVTVFGLTHVMPFNFRWSACTVIPFTLTVAAAARADVGGEPSPFRNRYIVYLGEISFAFYLVHEIAIFSANHFLTTHHVVLPLTLHMGLVFAVSLIGAVLLHEYVEKPGVRLLSRSRRKPPAGRHLLAPEAPETPEAPVKATKTARRPTRDRADSPGRKQGPRAATSRPATARSGSA